MALQYPGYAPIPTYESSLSAFMPAFEAGRTDRKGFDAQQVLAGKTGQAPPSFLEQLTGMFHPKPAPQAAPQTEPAVVSPQAPMPTAAGPVRQPQTAVAAIGAVAPVRVTYEYAQNGRPRDPDNGFLMATDDPRYAEAMAQKNGAPGVQVASLGNSVIPQGYMASARSAESGGNDAARNPNSTATGRYQFLESTWNGLASQYPELQLTADGRTDPAQQERAMERFTRDNAGALSSAGIPVDPGTLYAAHFLGAGGATKALTANPSTPMSALVEPGVIQANPQLASMSAGDFAQWAQSKGGNSSGGYSAPMPYDQPRAGNVRQFTPEEIGILMASEETRPFALQLLQNEQQAGRFEVMEQPDGSIRQIDRMTGQQSILQDAPTPEQRRIVQGPDGNSYYEDGSRVLPGVDAQPDPGFRTLTTDEATSMGFPPGAYQVGPDNKVSQIGSSGTNVTVNNGGEPALDKALNEAEGKTWSTFKEAAAVSASNAQDFEVLGELLTLAPQGPVTGRLADTFKGFSAAGDAANSIIKRIAPTLRAPGSGATSDIEYNGMLQSLPSLAQNPEANAMVLSIMQAKAQINMERGRIVTAYQNEDMTIDEARAAMDELNSRSIMTPEMKRALVGLGSDGAVGASPPQIGEEVEGYVYQGGDPSSPTSWTQVQ